MATEYLDLLHHRVQCYLKRFREEEAWAKYCQEQGFSKPVVPIKAPIGLEKGGMLNDMKAGSKKSQCVLLRNTCKKQLDQNLSSTIGIRNNLSHTKNTISETNLNSRQKQVPEHSKTVSKELIIQTPKYRNELIQKLEDISNAGQKGVATSFEERNGILSVLRNIPNDDVLCNTANMLRSEPSQRELGRDKSKSEMISGKEKEGATIHPFQVPPTILYLESHIWDELLDDTVRDLEKITEEESRKKKELALNTVRTFLQNLQRDEHSPGTVKIELEQNTTAVKYRETKNQMTLKHATDQQLGDRLVGSTDKKLSPIILNLSKKSSASILHGRSQFLNYTQKVWPPVSGIDDFHSTAIQVADSLLAEALDEIVQEMEQISGHIIESCLEQELLVT